MPLANKYVSTYRNVLQDSPDNREINNSVAMCYLKLRIYDKALNTFEKAMEDNFDNSETFFFAAVCLLRGQKAFNTPKNDIKKAMEYVNAALMIEPRGIYYYFLAYIKFDFYKRKHLNITPNYLAELGEARKNNVAFADIDLLFDVLQKSVPDEIKLQA